MSSVACARAPAAQPGRPNVLLVTIDTFRADRLGTGVAPALDRLAASGLRFTTARAAVPLTLPSHTTILTGLLPPVHGVRENGVDALSDAHPTIARLLKTAGYETAAFVGAFVLDRRFGLAQGFDTYDDQIPRDPNATERLEAERPASAVVDRAPRVARRTSPIRNPQSAIRILRVDPPLRSPRSLQSAHAISRADAHAVRRRDRVCRRRDRARLRVAARARTDRSHARRRRRRSRRRPRRPR